MAERALRGTRLGATSYENDRNTDLAPRQDVAFDCPNGHHFTVPFAAEAELPATWECRVCGSIAIAATGDSPSPKKAKPPRSHWDMLMERRSVEDLEAVLAERLAAASAAPLNAAPVTAVPVNAVPADDAGACEAGRRFPTGRPARTPP
jgi:rubredoxin